MNFLMAGMVPVMFLMMRNFTGAHDPLRAAFWFTMSMALLAGFAAAYPMNWWLVSNHLKHGMMTVRSSKTSKSQPEHSLDSRFQGDEARMSEARHDRGERKVGGGTIALMTVLSFLAFGVGLGICWMVGDL
ncbi:MAG: DUF4396 domain-containing protein [Nitrospirota bacterium]|nr:DUF4396 domain-containing protein [Nitrospirota bacterium]